MCNTLLSNVFNTCIWKNQGKIVMYFTSSKRKPIVMIRLMHFNVTKKSNEDLDDDVLRTKEAWENIDMMHTMLKTRIKKIKKNTPKKRHKKNMMQKCPIL